MTNRHLRSCIAVFVVCSLMLVIASQAAAGVVVPNAGYYYPGPAAQYVWDNGTEDTGAAYLGECLISNQSKQTFTWRFGSSQKFTRISWFNNTSSGDYMRSADVYYSTTGAADSWVQGESSGALGSSVYVTITLAQVIQYQYVRLVQTGIEQWVQICNVTFEAEDTPTPTPTITPTSTATPTLTRTPTRTPQATPTPFTTPTPWTTPVSGMAGTESFQSNQDFFQSAINTLTGYKTMAEAIEVNTRQTVNDQVLQIGAYSPFKYARGMLIVFQDFGWLMVLAGWFVFALVVILVVAAIRLIISLWGIVQRILELIKAIPFV